MNAMDNAPIYFQFTDKRSALLALDTLQELGFRADLMDHRHPDHKPIVQVGVDKEDLTSALEIAQAHGGTLLKSEEFGREPAVYTSAYGLETVPIPAHLVNEDLPESYLNGSSPVSEPATGEQSSGFDPSEEDYDHFPAGIRL